jgi:hypothetical protein
MSDLLGEALQEQRVWTESVEELSEEQQTLLTFHTHRLAQSQQPGPEVHGDRGRDRDLAWVNSAPLGPLDSAIWSAVFGLP